MAFTGKGIPIDIPEGEKIEPASPEDICSVFAPIIPEFGAAAEEKLSLLRAL